MTMKFQRLFQNWKDVLEFEPQTVIFSAGAPAEALYFILSGEIELSLHGRILSTEGEGGIVGTMAMVPSASHCATAMSLNGVKLARIDHSQLKALVTDNAEFSLHLMALLANRLRKADQLVARQIEPAE